MSLMDKLERRLGFLAIPKPHLYLIIAQVAMFGLLSLGGNEGEVYESLYFAWGRLPHYAWTFVTFLFLPPISAFLLFMVFSWMVFYMMGNALEEHFGSFRYNLFLLASVVGSLAAGLFFPYQPISNHMISTSVILAFAYLYPNMELSLFGVIPVKVKWIALLVGVGLVFNLSGAGLAQWVVALGGLLNVPLFFGKDLLQRRKAGNRVKAMNAAREELEAQPFHECARCGATDKSHPDREFRYRKDGAICSECLASEKAED